MCGSLPGLLTIALWGPNCYFGQPTHSSNGDGYEPSHTTLAPAFLLLCHLKEGRAAGAVCHVPVVVRCRSLACLLLPIEVNLQSTLKLHVAR